MCYGAMVVRVMVERGRGGDISRRRVSTVRLASDDHLQLKQAVRLKIVKYSKTIIQEIVTTGNTFDRSNILMSLVKSVCAAMERIAPLRLAESWDHVRTHQASLPRRTIT